MTDYRKELEVLRERIARHRKEQRMMEQLKKQEVACQQALSEYQLQYVKEQEEMDKLSHLSWSSLWAAAKGCLEEDLEREQAEVWAVQAKIQETHRQLEEIHREIEACRARVSADESCEVEYCDLLKRKETDYRRSDPNFVARMAELERRELAAATERRELNEALCVGGRVLEQMAAVFNRLENARNWSSWDIASNSVYADIMKYSNMDEAQRMIEELQSELRRYQAELVDVAQDASFILIMDVCTWGIDICFDNVFAAWMVRDRIIQASNRLEEVQQRVQQTQGQLESRLEDVQQRMESLRKEREETVSRA